MKAKVNSAKIKRSGLYWCAKIQALGVEEAIIPKNLSATEYAELYRKCTLIAALDLPLKTTDLYILNGQHIQNVINVLNSKHVAQYAAWSGNIEVLRALKGYFHRVTRDVSSNNSYHPYSAHMKSHLESDEGNNMAHFAAWSGNPEALEWIKRGSGLEYRYIVGYKPANPFYPYGGSSEVPHYNWTEEGAADYLLESKNIMGNTIAHYAAWSGHPEALEWIKNNVKHLLQSKNNNGDTIAHFAAASGNPEVLEWIKNNAPRLLESKNNNGFTIAHYAVWSDNTDVLQWINNNTPQLLEAKNKAGSTITNPEAFLQHKSIVPLLLSNDKFALHAAYEENLELLNWLKDNVPNSLESKDFAGRTIAHYAFMAKTNSAMNWIAANKPELLRLALKDTNLVAQCALASNSIQKFSDTLAHGTKLHIDFIQIAARGIAGYEPLTVHNGYDPMNVHNMVDCLASALQGNIKLTRLTVFNDSLGATGQEINNLIEGIKSNLYLTEVQFTGRKILDKADLIAIQPYLERNKRFYEIFFKPIEQDEAKIFKVVYNLKANAQGIEEADSLEAALFRGYVENCMEICNEAELIGNPHWQVNFLNAACSGNASINELDIRLAQHLFQLNFENPEKYRLILWLMRHNLNDVSLQNVVNSCVLKLQDKMDQGGMLVEHQPHLFFHQQQIIDAALKLQKQGNLPSVNPLIDSQDPEILLNDPLIREALGLTSGNTAILVDKDVKLSTTLNNDKEKMIQLIVSDAPQQLIKNASLLRQAVTEAVTNYKSFLNNKTHDNIGANITFFTRFRHGEHGRGVAQRFQSHFDEIANDPKAQIQLILDLLNKSTTRFNNHSFGTYLLVQLKSTMVIDSQELITMPRADLKSTVIKALEDVIKLPPEEELNAPATLRP